MRLLKTLGIIVILAVFGFVTMQLFFPEQLQKFVLREPVQQATESRPLLTIAFASDVNSLEPTSSDPDVRQRTLQIYEPLVKLDDFFNIQPVLAKSYGRIDDNQWEFQIRDNVKFHHGKLMTAQDVLESFKRAKNFSGSGLKDYAKFWTFSVTDSGRFRIKTQYPDPLLLSKVAQVLIFPSEFADQETFSAVGTGPYRFSSWKKGEQMVLKRFDDYWGKKPLYESAYLRTIPSGDDRVNAFVKGEVDLLAAVPPSSATSLEKLNYQVVAVPGLEVNYLGFNMDGIFQNKRLREAVARAIDPAYFVSLTEGFAKVASQFVGNGVFGFDPGINRFDFNSQSAKLLVKQVSKFETVPVRIGLPEGLEKIGDALKASLEPIGFYPKVKYYDQASYRAALLTGEADLFFFGWKSDLGTADDFFQSAVHKRDPDSGFGSENLGNYSSPEVDYNIADILESFDNKHRLEVSQKVMKTLVEDDIYGIPLITPQNIYAVSKDIEFTPRATGQIYLTDIR